MNSIRLKTTYIADSLPIGSSKFFGNPYVWKGFEWPAIEEDGEDLSVKEMKLDFEIVDAGYLDDTDSTHLLLGVPSLDYGTFYDIIDGWQMLLQIDSMETDEVVINFTDEGVLCFYIEPKKLENGDFSDVRIMQIYS